jgi:uncharacterized membrane protein SpoIIM required for sporulation
MSIKVVEIDATQPFCIGHHIDIYHNMLVTFVKTNAQKNFITFGLPTLCMAIKNGSNLGLAIEFSTFLSLNWATESSPQLVIEVLRFPQVMIEFLWSTQKK